MQPLLELPDQTLPDEIDEEILDIFVEEVNEVLEEMTSSFTVWNTNPDNTESLKTLQDNFSFLKDTGSLVGAMVISELGGKFENLLNQVIEGTIPTNDAILCLIGEVINLLPSMVEQFKTRQPIPDEVTLLISQASQLTDQLIERKRERMDDPNEETDEVPEVTDDSSLALDSECLALFLDDAECVLEENMQSLLERWQVTPHNLQLMKELQRELHTLKGASRMVGINAMGDLSHSLESVLNRLVEGGVQSNLELQEIVQNGVDELAAMVETVRSGVPLDMPIELMASINKIMEEIIPTPALEPEVTTRVPDALLDKLTNLVRELSISRARLEQQQGAVKNNLSEMEQAVARLRDRDQLRLEIETEAQILSHYTQILKGTMGIIDQKEFDPLELDRFSVMKQLSRSLLESIISDLLHIQEALKILTQRMDSLLLQQARIGAELHDAIMQTRMIPFSRISPRLQRIVGLTVRERQKQVNFIINGEQIEFERTVLNCLVRPLERMLRHTIEHGVEDASSRQQAGKPAIAKITLDISQEGTELILKLSDDGGGLDLPAIRKRAEELGWIKSDTVISDDELMQFILKLYVSRGDKILGRGLGMDMVTKEIKQLSGTLHVHSKAGQGTSFEIRLPHSLTID